MKNTLDEIRHCNEQMNVNTKQEKLFNMKEKEKGQEKTEQSDYGTANINWSNIHVYSPKRKWQGAEIFEEIMAKYNVFQIC